MTGTAAKTEPWTSTSSRERGARGSFKGRCAHNFWLHAKVAAAVLVGVGLNTYAEGTATDTAGRTITKEQYGITPRGETVDAYTLRNANGIQATIITYGARIATLKTPDRDGKLADVVLGYNDLEGYISDKDYLGATVGRFAGRIASGQFVLDGVRHHLSVNNGPNHLHGGLMGYSKTVWTGAVKETPEGAVLELTYISRDGEDGYPGNLSCTVTYSLGNDNGLRITFGAETDKPTIVNMTNHSYFNLSGYDAGDVLKHEMTIYADYYAPAEPEWLIPTGEIRVVKGTSLDFTRATPIGARVKQAPADFGGNNEGYDVNYALKNWGSLALAARVYDPVSGRVLEVLAQEPALQVYTSNFMDGTTQGKGVRYHRYAALCLEPQHFPNSPNMPHMPSVALMPGQAYEHTIIYRFSTRK